MLLLSWMAALVLLKAVSGRIVSGEVWRKKNYEFIAVPDLQSFFPELRQKKEISTTPAPVWKKAYSWSDKTPKLQVAEVTKQKWKVDKYNSKEIIERKVDPNIKYKQIGSKRYRVRKIRRRKLRLFERDLVPGHSNEGAFRRLKKAYLPVELYRLTR